MNMLFLLHISFLGMNILTTQGQNVCDCNEINTLKGIVQQILWDQKAESIKLAELEAWRLSSQVSHGTGNDDFVNRLENMEKKVFDIDKKLEKLIENADNGHRENTKILLRKTITSEKLERLEFVKDVKSQLTDMMESIADFKIEINGTVGKSVADMNASKKYLKKDVDIKILEIKDDTEKIKNAIFMNMTIKINENVEHLTQLNESLYEARTDIKDIQRIAINGKVDGQWSDWGKWSDCSASCGSGLRYRERSCSSPTPSLLGRQCEGNNMQTDMCIIVKCREPQVAFHAYGIKAGSSRANIPSFPVAITNIGNDYNTETGIFTCEIPGLYNFAVTLSIKDSMISTLLCHLYINNKEIFEIFVKPRGKDLSDLYPASSSGVFHLSKGDTVFINNCEEKEYNYIYADSSTSFMGYLVTADD